MAMAYAVGHKAAAARRLAGGQRRAPARLARWRAASTAVEATEGLIFTGGDPGAWDEAAVGTPVVRCYVGDNDQRWFMWYSGCSQPVPGMQAVMPSAGSIGVATSKDGVTWQRGSGQVEGERGESADDDVGSVLQPNGDWWWLDTCHVTVADVQVLSNASVSSGVGVYWMFYTGGDFEALPAPAGMPGVAQGAPLEGLRMRPGLAMSQDGRNWARIEGDHHTGALFDVGEPGEWDALYIGQPQVVAAGPRDLRMYYHSFDATTQRYAVGLATSPDGFRWTKQGRIFEGSGRGWDSKGAASCQVVRDPDAQQWLMFYEGVREDGSRGIGMATSADGRTGWQAGGEPVLAPSAASGAWDAGSVGGPCAVPMSAGRWRLYYAGRGAPGAGGAWQGVGLALSSEGQRLAPGVQFKRRTGRRTEAVDGV